jgi:hypothetical protein
MEKRKQICLLQIQMYICVTKANNMTTQQTIKIENREYKVLEVSPASKYPALQREYSNIIGFMTVEGKRGGLFIAVVKESGIFLS